jgi:hypothetical protein
MTEQIKPPQGGGNPRSPKRTNGSSWLRKRARKDKTWQQRKMRSARYCPANKTR